MRVLALTRYERLGSSSRVRFYQYFPYLKSQGVEIINAPFFNDDYVKDLYSGRKASFRMILQSYFKRISLLTRKDTFDLLWVEKELLPWFPAGMEDLFQFPNIPYVVDYDDAVFHRYDMHSFTPVRWFLGNKIDHVMQNAKLVIVGNEYLADRARKAGANNVEYLPSVVDVSQYVFKPQETDSIFKIGWIGSPVTAPYLNMIHEVVNMLNPESDIRLVLVGAGNSQLFPDIPTEILPWSEDSELNVSQQFDVGIMPLVGRSLRAWQVRVQIGAIYGWRDTRHRLPRRRQPTNRRAWHKWISCKFNRRVACGISYFKRQPSSAKQNGPGWSPKSGETV